MTQAELAEKMFVSVQAVSKWENDNSPPDLERIGQLAKSIRYNCRKYYLWGKGRENIP